MEYTERARTLVARMTPEEKVRLLRGRDFWHSESVERLGIPSVMLTDGPHGLRKQAAEGREQLGIADNLPATCFPTASATACTFDRELLREIGAAMGEECRQEEVAVILGPGLNIKRSPLCGRNFEYFSEDPILAGELAAAMVQGIQSQGVGASVKHFAANNQETRRMVSESVMDERALRELYLQGFERAVTKGKPWTVMCSYNRLKGEYASENKWLLTDVLRDEWGYEGLVVSDWGAVNDRLAALRAGLDLEMPYGGPENDAQLLAALESGALTGEELDKSVTRVVELILRSEARNAFCCDFEAHHALARRAAAESAVLLKNEGKLLPLSKGASLAVIGAFAKTPRYQGAGSSKMHPYRLDNALDELAALGAELEYAEGYSLESDVPDEKRIAAACKVAAGKDAAVLFLGLPDAYEAEGFDRKSMTMPASHTALLSAVRKVNANTVVVLSAGAPVETDWEGDAKAILLSYLGGEAGAGAAADILLGRANPCGKLAESWPLHLSDAPSSAYFPGYPRTVEYRESLYVGYRYYDTAGLAVRYPFGYGLSYTSFVYEDLRLDKTRMTDGEALKITFRVRNTGTVEGKETVQLYVAPCFDKAHGPFMAVQQLRCFEKLLLLPGEAKELSFTLGKRDFAYYNTNISDWCVESGEYELRIAASSRDIRLTGRVFVAAEEKTPAPDYRQSAPCYYDLRSGLHVSDAAFSALLGHPLPQREKRKEEPHTINSMLCEMRDRPIGRLFAWILKRAASSYIGNNKELRNMMESSLLEMPLRALTQMSGGFFTRIQAEGIVDMLNGHFFVGLGRILRKK